MPEIRPGCLNPSTTGRKGEETLGVVEESTHKSSSVHHWADWSMERLSGELGRLRDSKTSKQSGPGHV